MFSGKENIERIETLIGEQCNIVGTLNGGGVIKIDGSVNGDISWQDDVILGSFSIYEGNLTCKNAFISGKVKGNIFCEECLTIESTGTITGDIITKKLIVKDGGTLDGKCTMLVPKNAEEILD